MSYLQTPSSSGGVNGHWQRHVGTVPFKLYYESQDTVESNQQATVAANLIYANPFPSGLGGMVDEIAISSLVAGSVGMLIRLGIYASTSDNNVYPSSLIADSGDIDFTSVAAKIAPISAKLAAGKLYWLVLVANNTVFRTNWNLGSAGCVYLGRSNIQIASQGNIGIQVSRAFGAFPATFPAGGSLIGGVSPAMPRIYVHFAS